MKKLFITLALALGLVMTVQAQERGLFNQGSSKGSYDNYSTDNRDGEAPMFGLPGSHGSTEDAQTPLGTGTALLLGLGAAYLATKNRKNQKNRNTRFFLMAAALTAGYLNTWAQETPAYSLTFEKLSTGTNFNSYTAAHTITVSDKGWSVYGNQSLGAFLGVGGKNTTALDRTLTSNVTVINKNIYKAVINHLSIVNGKNSSLTINSITIEGSTNSSFPTNGTISKTITSPSVSSSGSLTFEPDEAWVANSYFRIKVNCQISGSNNCYIKIESINFYEEQTTEPTITVPTAPLTDFTYSHGNGPSEPQSFTVSGVNLTTNLSITAPTHYELRQGTDGSWTNSISLIPSSGTVSSTTIYARLKSGLSVGNYNSENVNITSTGATAKTVSLSGSVTGYTLTYNGNGNTSGSVPTDATAYGKGASVTIKDNTGSLVKTHYDFAGWTRNIGSTPKTYAPGDTLIIKANTTVNAVWAPKTHTFTTTVTPDNSGTIVAKNSSNETVASGSAVAETAQLTLTATPAQGYNFTSWSFEGTGSTLSSTSTNPTTFTMGTDNATVTATFTARTPATVTLHHGEGGNTTTVVNTYTDATVGDLTAPATVNGWTTMGWVLSYTSGNPALVSSSTLIDAIDDANHELTLYAVYTKGSNTFSRITSTDDLESGTYMICGYGGSNYYLMDGSGTNVMNRTTAITVTNNSFEYSVGKKFVLGGTSGAYTFYDGSKYLSTEETSNSTLLTLSDELGDYGKWDISFTTSGIVQIKKNNTSRYVSYYHNSSAFNCYTTPNTVYLFKQTSNDLQISTTPVGDKCTVTYDVNGGDGTAPTDNTQYNVGATVTVADGTGLSKTGYSFNGWNTKANGTGTAHAANSTFTINENTTLYAQWAIQSYAYTLNVTGADATASAVLKVDNENVGANASIQYNKEVTIAVTLSDAAAYVYNVSVVKTGTTDAVTVSNNKFTMPDSPVTVTVTTVVNPYRYATLSSSDMQSMSNAGTAYGTLKSKTIDGLTWETNGRQDVFPSGSSTPYGMIQLRDRTHDDGVSYFKLPSFPGKIETITFAVTSSTGTEPGQSGKACKGILCFQETTAKDATIVTEGGDGSNGTYEITFDLSSKFYTTGYITIKNSSLVARIWNITITYLPYSNFTELDPSEPLPVSLTAGANVAVPSDMSTTDLAIPSTAAIVVKSGATLTVTGALTNSGTAANLVIEDGGQLKFASTGAKDGEVQATVEKNIAAWDTGDDGGWYFIASPINVNNLNPSTVSNMLPADEGSGDNIIRNYDLYWLEDVDPIPMWRNYRNTSFNLSNGQGYLYARSEDATLEFAGSIKPYDANHTITVTAGWNLVGNPYTFNAYPNHAYYTISNANTGITAQTATSSAAVAPCTGIIVKAVENGSIKFLDEAPVGAANNGNLQMTLSQTAATRGGNNTETLDNAIVSFNEGTQLEKFYFGEQSANIFIPQGNEEYAIVSAEAQGEMPVSFVANKEGEYTISVNVEDVEMDYLHLIDNIAGNDVDLLTHPSYTFKASNDDYPSRFRLVFSAINNGNDNENFAFISNGQIILTTDACDASLQVIDMMGRIVSTEQVNGNSIRLANLAKGVYVLRLVGNKVKTQKIVVE